MNILAQALAIITTTAIIFSVFRPSRVLTIYLISRPIIQPFIFLQYKFYFLPYSVVWALILPIVYVVNLLRGRWTVFCYKSTPLLILLFIGLLSFPFTIDIRASIIGLIKLTTVFCAFGIAYNSVNNLKEADTVIKSVILASIIPMMFGFYQEITGNYDQIYNAAVNRVNSVFGQGNTYGIFLTNTMCAALVVLLSNKLSRKSRIIFTVIFGAMVASQVFALNRGTWIAMTIGIIVSLYPYRKKVKIRWFVLGGLVVAILFSSVIYERFTDEGYRYTGEKKDTFMGRVRYWQYLTPLILERPLLGHGIGTTATANDERGLLAPHNDYIRLAVDIGVIGSMVYMYFLISLALFYLRRRNRFKDTLFRYNFPMAILTCYIIIISTTQNIIYNLTNFVIFMILNGIVIKLNVIERNKPIKKTNIE